MKSELTCKMTCMLESLCQRKALADRTLEWEISS
jgi:hypothetical protein